MCLCVVCLFVVVFYLFVCLFVVVVVFGGDGIKGF